MKARRILYVDTGRSFGGAERITLDLASAFARMGADVRCLVDPGAERLRDALARRDLPHRPVAEADRLSRIPAVAREVRRFRPDIVHIHRTWPLSDRYASWAARRGGARRIVSTEHVLWERCGLRDRAAKRLLARFDRTIVAVSRAVRESLTGFWGIAPSRVTVVTNGIDTERFRDSASRADGRGLFPENAPHRIGAIGRLEEQKGYDVLIDAIDLVAREEPGVAFLIVGEGSLRTALEGKVRLHGLERSVHFAGAVPDIRALLGAFDLFVLASRWEGLPLTVLEAMAAGVPVVATGAAGTAEAIRDGIDGILVPIDDRPALAAAILGALRDRPAARARAVSARARVEEHFSLHRMIGAYRRIYEQ